jgi:hypothetical protein
MSGAQPLDSAKLQWEPYVVLDYCPSISAQQKRALSCPAFTNPSQSRDCTLVQDTCYCNHFQPLNTIQMHVTF